MRNLAKYALKCAACEICGIYANFRICGIICAYAILKTKLYAEQEILQIVTNLITPRALFSSTYLLNLVKRN